MIPSAFLEIGVAVRGEGGVAWAILWASACTTEPAPLAEPPARPDLTLILVSGLRGDPVVQEVLWRNVSGARGGRRPAARFSTAHAQSTVPFVSLGSVLTGRYPSAIPLCGLLERQPADAMTRPWCADLPDDLPSLPDVLGAYGYRTALLSANVGGAGFLGEDFDTFVDLTWSWEDANTPWGHIASEATEWWQGDDSRPRLLTLVVSHPLVALRPDLKARMGISGERGAAPHLMRRANLLPPYLAAVSEVGFELGALLDELDGPRPRWDVVGSLHGQNLGESSGTQPFPRSPIFSDLLLARTLQVPLAIYGPAPPRDVDDVVELIDVLPTMTALAGAVRPAGLEGADLLDSGYPGDPDARAYAELGDMLALRRGRYLLTLRALEHHLSAVGPKLTRILKSWPAQRNRYRLHDVQADPMQRSDLMRTMPNRAVAMIREMTAIRERSARGRLTPEQVAALERLRLTAAEGYW